MSADQPASPQPPGSVKTVEAIARDWAICVQRPSFTDWVGLTQWLAEDPSHAPSFDRMAIREAELAELIRDIPSAEPRNEPVPTTAAVPLFRASGRAGRTIAWRWVAGLGLPIVLAGSLLMREYEGRLAGAHAVTIAVQSGQQKQLELADGSHITIAGDTALTLDRVNRQAILQYGRANFDIVHHPDKPFSVQIGDATVTDIGTRFSLRRSPDGVEVAVAQGRVRLERADTAFDIAAGQVARLSRDGRVRASAISEANVGSWAQGRLFYADASIATVAADLSAATGVPIQVSPAVARLPFGGSIVVRAAMRNDLRPLAPILGVSVNKQSQGWLFGPPSAVASR